MTVTTTAPDATATRRPNQAQTDEIGTPELALRAGESATGPGWCAMCGWAPCEMAGADSPFTPERLCYQAAHPQPLSRWAMRTANLLLNDLGLPGSAADWPGTGDMLRAVAAELTWWADRAAPGPRSGT